MLVIFDWDGVLIDSESIFCTVDAEALTALGHQQRIDYLRTVCGDSRCAAPR